MISHASHAQQGEFPVPSEVESHPSYAGTIKRLEAVKRKSSSGVDYWMARDINELLGYPTWREFKAVMERAKNAMIASGINPSHQIVLTHKMMEVAGGARIKREDFFLTRPACRLIAMNGDPQKPEIAGAQAYFVVQTHRMEQQDAATEDEKRLELRKKVTTAFRTVSGIAQDAGVSSRMQPIFHDARYQGLYGMSGREVKRKKGLKDSDNPFDFAGPLELSANEFQMNMAADAIKNERIRGEQNAIRKNRKIAEDVRSVMRQNGATMPENLPIAEPIREVQKRLKKSKKLPPKA
jgi:DNA-damage-inducible protein D